MTPHERHELLEVLWRVQDELEDIRKLMIAQSVLDTSLANLTTAVTAAVAKLGGTVPPSTPDTVVQAYITGVDAQTAALTKAETPATP